MSFLSFSLRSNRRRASQAEEQTPPPSQENDPNTAPGVPLPFRRRPVPEPDATIPDSFATTRPTQTRTGPLPADSFTPRLANPIPAYPSQQAPHSQSFPSSPSTAQGNAPGRLYTASSPSVTPPNRGTGTYRGQGQPSLGAQIHALQQSTREFLNSPLASYVLQLTQQQQYYQRQQASVNANANQLRLETMSSPSPSAPGSGVSSVRNFYHQQIGSQSPQSFIPFAPGSLLQRPLEPSQVHRHPHANRRSNPINIPDSARNATRVNSGTASSQGQSGANAPSIRPQFRTKVVCEISCRHCSKLVCKRGMKAILLADTNIELYSTDSPPFGVQLVEEDYVTRNCLCRIRDAACLSCGNVLGYHVTQPCETCLDACNNGHFWMFHMMEITSRDRIRGEKVSSEGDIDDGKNVMLWAHLPVVDQDIDPTAPRVAIGR